MKCEYQCYFSELQCEATWLWWVSVYVNTSIDALEQEIRILLLFRYYKQDFGCNKYHLMRCSILLSLLKSPNLLKLIQIWRLCSRSVKWTHLKNSLIWTILYAHMLCPYDMSIWYALLMAPFHTQVLTRYYNNGKSRPPIWTKIQIILNAWLFYSISIFQNNAQLLQQSLKEHLQ